MQSKTQAYNPVEHVGSSPLLEGNPSADPKRLAISDCLRAQPFWDLYKWANALVPPTPLLRGGLGRVWQLPNLERLHDKLTLRKANTQRLSLMVANQAP